jgi:hypothetical protein
VRLIQRSHHLVGSLVASNIRVVALDERQISSANRSGVGRPRNPQHFVVIDLSLRHDSYFGESPSN